MFTFVENLTFRETVKVRMPKTAGTGFEEKTFTGHFRVLDDEQIEAQNFDTLEGLKSYVRQFFIGWDGIVADDPKKTPIPFSDEARDQLIGVPFIRAAILATYNAGITGALGKLTEAGRVWARGAATDPAKVDADLAFFGLERDPLDEVQPGFAVWMVHRPALRAFLAVSGQWRTAGGGMGQIVWIGLDYTAARAGLDLAGIEVTPALWAQVQEVESGAMEVLNSGR